MKTGALGVIIEDNIQSIGPTSEYVSFTDYDGARIIINNKTLMKLYDCLRYDAGVHGYLHIFDKDG